MLTIWGGKGQKQCDGATRRDFLRIGAFGAGLTLADMLRVKAGAAEPGRPTRSMKSAIMIYLPGGPTHMDTYDLKPDAPAEFRGEFQPIQTNVPGVRICEHFPLQARMWDKLACIRSIVTVNEHSDAMVMTGHKGSELMTGNYPSFGSVVSRMRSQHGGAPPFVSLRNMTRGTEPGYLGIQHRPFTPSGPGLANLAPIAQVDAGRRESRQQMLAAFDNVRREADTDGSLAGLDRFSQQAFDMVASGGVRNALDITNEPSASRRRYEGIQEFLRARRLVELGVGCVTLSFGSWDTHSNNFATQRRQLPNLDRGISTLIQDLHERGLGEQVVTVVWGEFGRTPRINRNAGRDHWPSVMSAMIAGGGLRMGQAVGASSARGETPVENRCTPAQVLSTIYRALGIDPGTTILDNTGRPRHILTDREPLRGLL